MENYMKFFQLLTMCILFSFGSAKQPSTCNRDSLVKKELYHFNYHNFDDWGKMYPLCNGKQQSPINLGSNVDMFRVDKFPVKTFNYDQRLSHGVLYNNGNTVHFKGCWDKNKPILTGPIVHWEKYEFYTIMVHWSTADHNGTEHSIRGKRYAAEIHIVQKNIKYPDVLQALKEKDGMLVTALLFQHNQVKLPNKGIQQMAKFASKVSKKGAVAKTDFDMSLLEFHAIKSFYTYKGSLTRPPCSENIRWFVSADLLPIDDESLNLLRSVKLDSKDKSNIRPLQKIKGRKVTFYSKIE